MNKPPEAAEVLLPAQTKQMEEEQLSRDPRHTDGEFYCPSTRTFATESLLTLLLDLLFVSYSNNLQHTI